jgi:PiT family inorganic phosphate transporter
MSPLLILLITLAMVLIFTYTNGFHDAANAVATIVSTRILTARQAVIFGATFNLIGALGGVAVATTIGKGLVDTDYVTSTTVLCAMIAGISWNLLTWWFGLPSSSSHALIGGLLGAALATAKNNWHVIKWSASTIDAETGHVVSDGLYHKVILPMITAPIIGFVGGFLVMGILFWLVRDLRNALINAVFGKLQLISSCYMAWSQGFADGQKTMGIMALALFSATTAGQLEHLPRWLGFLYTPKFEVHLWIKLACGLAMAMGTYLGGWRIIATMGRNLVKLKPINGFAAEATAATLLLVTGRLGMPISTTHSITTAIMGVGAAKSFNAVKWPLVERILWGWILTIPATALLAYFLVKALEVVGMR